jgi:adenosylcobyric acid synthase
VLADAGLLAGTKGQEISGYEIHMGQTRSEEKSNAFQIIETPQGPADYADGVLNPQGTILGTYLHGLFHNDDFRRYFLNTLRRYWGLPENEGNNTTSKEQQYDKLAGLVRQSLDIPAIYRITEESI